MPSPQYAKPARKSARCGVGDGSQRGLPPHIQPVGSGPRPHASGTGRLAWGSAQPQMPHTQARGAPPRAPSWGPHSAQSQLARARAVRMVTGPHAHTPAPASIGERAPAARPKDGRSGVGERPTPDAPHPGKRRPPQAPSCSPHSAQSYGIGDRSPLPHPSHPQPVGSGPRPHALRTGGRAKGSTQPRTSDTQASGSLPRAPSCRPTARKASLQERALWDWWRVPTPTPPAHTASG